MSWLRIDDGFEDHGKVEPLSDAAHRLWMRAACWCQKPENARGRGFVPRALLPTIARRSAPPKRLEKLAQELVDAKGGGMFDVGLWEPIEDSAGKLTGWQFHDWEDYQPPPEDPDEISRKRSEAGRKGAAARWQKDALPSKLPSGLPPPLPKQTHGKRMAKHAPDPVPDPDPDLDPTSYLHPKDLKENARISAHPDDDDDGLVSEWLTCPRPDEVIAWLGLGFFQGLEIAGARTDVAEQVVKRVASKLCAEQKRWNSDRLKSYLRAAVLNDRGKTPVPGSEHEQALARTSRDPKHEALAAKVAALPKR